MEKKKDFTLAEVKEMTVSEYWRMCKEQYEEKNSQNEELDDLQRSFREMFKNDVIIYPKYFVSDECMKDMLDTDIWGCQGTYITKTDEGYNVDGKSYTSDTKLTTIIDDICEHVRKNFHDLWMWIYRDINQYGHAGDIGWYYALPEYMRKNARKYGVRYECRDGEMYIYPLKKYEGIISSIAFLTREEEEDPSLLS